MFFKEKLMNKRIYISKNAERKNNTISYDLSTHQSTFTRAFFIFKFR